MHAHVHSFWSTHAEFQKCHAFSLSKERLPTSSNSHNIYLYKWWQRESRYVGKTYQLLSKCIKQHKTSHPIETADHGKKKRQGCPPKQRAPDKYQSAIACLLAGKNIWRQLYSDHEFSVLLCGHSKHHLPVLEPMYHVHSYYNNLFCINISRLSPIQVCLNT